VYHWKIHEVGSVAADALIFATAVAYELSIAFPFGDVTL
jgi:adenine/guanine phosphoribosyltransferase-like PRPP-binding protein